MAEVFIALGGNVGDRRKNMEAAFAALARGPVHIVRRSRIYEAVSWGPVPQGKYYDSVVLGKTALPPHALLAELNKIETRLGRNRKREIRYGPRTIDLDILLYGRLLLRTADLEIPHRLMLKRAFVLVPLLEIAPDLVVKGIRISDALARLKSEANGVMALSDGA
ncbi:MAG TPA: 2-amino-4-hydroxy-6-hydroxymethyldihydropteridine diphosphokinase [Xanthobacteraceae bacterium]|nr:2-amino-4-hydroxy-6-hydroxymethyldihydropteridine diphosphokinase [Xanthobacteraceae bacterium]